MIAYMFDENTKEFVGEIESQLDPLESELKGEEIYLLPANSTFTYPLESKEGFKVVFNGDEWIYQKTPIEEHVKESELTDEEIKQNRIQELKLNLYNTDYVVIKIAEGEATADEYSDVLSKRKAWRVEINQLES